MGYYIYKLSNASEWGDEIPTVSIEVGDDGWAKAYADWLSGKNPTDSPEWKKGVMGHCKPSLTASEALLASGLFASKSAMLRAVKGRGVKINRVIVESPEDSIDNAILLNAWVIPHGIELIQNKTIVIQHGKLGAFVKLTKDGPVRVEI